MRAAPRTPTTRMWSHWVGRASAACATLTARFWSRRLRRTAGAAACGMVLACGAWFGVPPAWQRVEVHPYFAIGHIAVDGNQRLSRSELLQWAGVADGSSIWEARPDDIRLRLQANPWVERVRVRREFPSRLSIAVHERRPVAIARLAEFVYVDRDGRVLGALREDDGRDFPLITGLEDVDAAVLPMRVRRVLRFVRLCERIHCFDAVSEIHVDPQRGLTVFPLHTAVAVVLGWGGWREKLARSARVFAAWEGQVGRLAAVDVSFRDLVVVKLQEEHHPAAVRARKRGTRV